MNPVAKIKRKKEIFTMIISRTFEERYENYVFERGFVSCASHQTSKAAG